MDNIGIVIADDHSDASEHYDPTGIDPDSDGISQPPARPRSKARATITFRKEESVYPIQQRQRDSEGTADDRSEADRSEVESVADDRSEVDRTDVSEYDDADDPDSDGSQPPTRPSRQRKSGTVRQAIQQAQVKRASRQSIRDAPMGFDGMSDSPTFENLAAARAAGSTTETPSAIETGESAPPEAPSRRSLIAAPPTKVKAKKAKSLGHTKSGPADDAIRRKTLMDDPGRPAASSKKKAQKSQIRRLDTT